MKEKVMAAVSLDSSAERLSALVLSLTIAVEIVIVFFFFGGRKQTMRNQEHHQRWGGRGKKAHIRNFGSRGTDDVDVSSARRGRQLVKIKPASPVM